MASAALAPRAHAANTVLYWDADGAATTATGGTGTWDTTSSLWRLGSATGALQTYMPNADPSTLTADFGGTAGTVTLAAGQTIYANALTFETSGYTIASASGAVLDLSGTTPTITGSGTTTISAALAGTNGFTQTGGSFTILTGNLTGLSGTINDNTRINLDGTKETGSQFQTWNVAGLLTSQNTGTASTIQLGALSGAGTVRAGNTGVGTPAGTDVFQVGALNTNTTFSGTIVDFAPALTGLTKVGTGTLTLSGNSTYTGGTLVSGGTLSLAKGGGSGTVMGAITVGAGATLNLSTGDAIGYGTGTSVTTINVNGGTVTSTAGNNEGFVTSYNLTGGTVAAGGLFRFNVNAATPPTIASSASGTTSLFAAGIDDFPNSGTAGSLTVNVASGTTASGVDLTISGAIGSGGGLVKTGSGYLNLTGQSTFTGPVTISTGTLNVGVGAVNNGSTGAMGVANTGKTITVSAGATLSGTVNNWFGNNGNTDANLPVITVNGGTLSTTRYTTVGALNLNGATVTATSSDTGNYQAFALRGNVTVGGTATSTITSTNVSTTQGGYHLGANTTFTVASTGSASPDLTVSAPLINQSGDFGSAAGGLTKAGAGSMVLTATNTYTGPTTVNAGTLLVTGSTASSSAVTVNNSGTILGGTGTVAGTVSVGNGAIISAGNSVQSVTGKLTTGALTLATGSTFNALLASNTSFSTLSAGGTTALGNAAFSISTTAGATFTPGTILELITTPTTGTFTNSTFMSGGYTFAADYTTNPGNFDVDIAAVPEPATWFGGLLLVGAAVASRRRQINGWLSLARG